MWNGSCEDVAQVAAIGLAALTDTVMNALLVIGALWLVGAIAITLISRRRRAGAGSPSSSPPPATPTELGAPVAADRPSFVEPVTPPPVSVAPQPSASEEPATSEVAVVGPEPTVSDEAPPTVLLVEDEEAVRELTRRILKRRGFDVVEAADAGAARALFPTLDRHPDLLITDVVMPGSSGKELADGLRVLHPPLRVLFMSGYADSVVLRYGVEGARDEVLQKPFDAAQLTAAVQRALVPPI